MDDSPEVPHHRSRGTSRVCYVAGCTAAVAIVIWSLVSPTQQAMVNESRKQPAQREDDDAANARAPQRSKSPFLNTRIGIKYVGSSACQNCHDDAHRTFTLTPHSRSLTRVNPESHPADAIVDHAMSRRSYRVRRSAEDDGQVLHSESVLHNGQRTELAA